MKEGWEYKKLGEVCDFEGGSQPPKSEWINHSQEGYVRMLQIRDFTKSRNFEIEYVKITKKLRLCKADDILIGRYGASVGKILTGLAGAYNVAIIKSIPNEKVIAKSYIRRYFESSLFQGILFKVCASRAAQAGFSKEDICDALIPIPPLSEQQSIVDYLDSAFAKIDAMKANAEKRLNEAKALFQASLKEMLEPKEGWVHNKLGDVCNVVGGGTPDTKNKDYWSGNIPWATVSDMNCDVLKSTGYYITDKGLNESSSRIIKTGEIIIATRVGLGKVCKLAVDTAINQDLKGIIPKNNNILRDFIFYYFKHKTKYIVDNGIGATVKGVKIKFIEGLSFDYPSLSEQQSIVETLDSLKSKVDRLQKNYDKISQECDALKQAILRQVFE